METVREVKWILGGLCLLGVIARAGAAAPSDDVSYGAQLLRCESTDGGRVHCAMDSASGVQMVRQLSSHSCIRGSDWDVDRNGVWVVDGCRAEFRAMRPDDDGGGEDAAPRQVRMVIRCESRGGRESCPVMLGDASVRLLRQTSSWPCREGSTWGVRRNEVWVSRGCAGEFEIGAQDGSGFVQAPHLITCESRHHRRQQCGVSIERGARLHRQLSGTPCDEGRSWGWDAGGVWVDGGCRAEFQVE